MSPESSPIRDPSRRRACPGLLNFVAAASLCSPLLSCNIVGPVAYLALGPPKVEAQFLLVDRPTLVFVDDRNNAIPLNASRIRRAIADKASTDLMAKEILTKTISPRDAMALTRQRDRNDRLLPIEAIGEIVDAEQVIYVEMISFVGSPDGVTPRATAVCRVKVIDVANRTRVFPAPDAPEPWQLVSATTRAIDLELYRTPAGRRQIEQMLAEQLGDRVAKLFYKHVPDELGSRLQRR